MKLGQMDLVEDDVDGVGELALGSDAAPRSGVEDGPRSGIGGAVQGLTRA